MIIDNNTIFEVLNMKRKKNPFDIEFRHKTIEARKSEYQPQANRYLDLEMDGWMGVCVGEKGFWSKVFGAKVK